jgi:chemotaxis protein MotA
VDIVTLSGIVAGFGMALGAVVLGPISGTFVDISSLMFVFGGTCAAILLTLPAQDVRQGVRIGIRAFAARGIPARDAVSAMVSLAEISCKEGIMVMDKIQTTNPVLKKAAQLIADNADPDLIRDTLDIEILSLRRTHQLGIAVFSRLALLAPVMGMLGTLTGFVQILTRLKSPDALGPDIAVALMASLYGCLLAILVFLPVVGKVKSRYMQEEYRLIIIFEGANCILENNNPKLVFEKLSSFLTPKERAGAW